MRPSKPYLREVRHSYKHEDLILDEPTWSAMWELFVQIGVFWKNVEDPRPMYSNWAVFITNRIRHDPSYKKEYENAAEVIRELVGEFGKEEGYAVLFTDPRANIPPPSTPLARARQLVSNEFVALQMALGGFLPFGAVNFPSYFGGPNIPGAPAPYRTYESEDDQR